MMRQTMVVSAHHRWRASWRHAGQLLLTLVVMAAGVTTASLAYGQPVDSENRAAARALGKDGMALFEQGKYAAALDRLSRAHTVVGLSTTGLWRARCLEKLGRLVEAAEQYLEVSRMKPGPDARAVHRNAVGDARRERQALLPRIPKVRLLPQGDVSPDAIVRIDGKAVPPALLGVARPVDPGEHLLEVEQSGQRREQRFTIAEGASLDVPFAVGATPPGAAPGPTASESASPVPPVEPASDQAASGGSTQALLGWVAVGLGGAGLIAGAVTGGLALDRQSALDEGCTDGDCPPALHEDVDAFETFRTVSAATLIAGGVLALGGLTLVLTAPSAEPDGASAAAAALTIGADRVRLRVAF